MISKSEKSHLSLLRIVIPDISTITNDAIGNILNSLETKQKSKLSDNYKISILRTLRKYNNNITKKPHQLKFKSNRHKQSINIDNTKIIIDVIKNTYTLSTTMIEALDTRSIIDSYISILLITSCLITIKDIYTLTEQDLTNLVLNQTITKHTKIIINSLFLKSEPLIRELIQKRNTLSLIHSTRLISCSPNIINKTLKFICIETAATSHEYKDVDKQFFNSIGLNKFKFKQPDILYTAISQ